MGLLDSIDSSDFLSSILGGQVNPSSGDPTAGGYPYPNPQPAPQASSWGLPNDQGIPVSGQQNQAMPMPGMSPALNQPLPPPPQGMDQGQRPPGFAQPVPLPRPNPNGGMADGNVTPITNPGPPLSLAPPVVSGQQPAAGGGPYPSGYPYGSNTSIYPPGTAPQADNGLLAQLGIKMSPEQKAGLAKGLTAVGTNWNKPGLAAFAGSAGAALEGESTEGDKQQTQKLAAQNQNFNQISTAFKDMMTAKQTDSQELYRKAQEKYLQARADAVANGRSGNNIGNTPYGKAIQIESAAQKWATEREKTLRDQWKMNDVPPAQQNLELEKLAKDKEAMKQNLYRQAGIDPTKGAQLSSMGTTHDNPFNTQGMTLDQFHQTVPVGAWYTDQNGVLRQRTKGPPGQNSSDAGSNYDDYAAMSG